MNERVDAESAGPSRKAELEAVFGNDLLSAEAGKAESVAEEVMLARRFPVSAVDHNGHMYGKR